MTSQGRYLLLIIFSAFLILGSCASSGRGQTAALMDAVEAGDMTTVNELISETKDVNGRDDKGRSALHYAAMSEDILVAAALLNAGADSNLADKSGRTALHYAVLSCNPDLIAMLLAAGADPMLADDDDATALDLAEASECEDVGQILSSSMKTFVPEQ